MFLSETQCVSTCLKVSLLCSQCTGRLVYQGDTDAVFNWSNKFLITHEACFDYTDHVAIPHARLPFSQHFEAMSQRFKRCAENPMSLMGRVTHRCIMYVVQACNACCSCKVNVCMCRLIMQSFIKALDIRYDELFCCKTCMQDGAALVLDAKAMGVKRSTFKLYVPPRAAAASIVRIMW